MEVIKRLDRWSKSKALRAWFQYEKPERNPRRSAMNFHFERLEMRCLLSGTYVVNNAGDVPDAYVNDGIADITGIPFPASDPAIAYSGQVTLRAAIMQAVHDGGGTITFAIGSGHVVISTAGLPTINVPIVIDATTQPGYAGKPLVELHGAGAGAVVGLYLMTGNSTVKGMVINGFTNTGIIANGSNDIISGNYIGTDFTGNSAVPNGGSGILIAGGSNNTIGGTAAKDRNVVSGNAYLGIELNNASNNKIIGNYVGVDATGTKAIGNGLNPPDGQGTRSGIGVFNGSHNIIGGTTPGERNLVSGNGNMGIQIQDASNFNEIRGNYVGTDVTGMLAIGNLVDGVHIHGGNNNVIGVNAAGLGANLISGNVLNGVRIHGDGTNTNFVQGNIIGLAIDEKTNLDNLANGVHIESRFENGSYEAVTNNIIGGPKDYDRNIISGNKKDGVLISGKGASGNIVEFNYIGTDSTGKSIKTGQDFIGNLYNGVEINGAPGNTIGGLRSAPSQLGNAIAGNSLDGILITGADAAHNSIIGNNIGTDPDGKIQLGNFNSGVAITFGAHDNTVGGALDAKLTLGNVIVDNDDEGVFISDANTSNNKIQGNYIGVARDGKTLMGNGNAGVWIKNGASNNTIGGLNAGNIISGNDLDGVEISDTTTTGNKVQANRIGLSVTGTTKIPNLGNGVLLNNGATNNTIGGDATGLGNTIAGNHLSGVALNEAVNNKIQGNFIGTDSDNTKTIGNGGNGISIDDVDGANTDNKIGGTTDLTRNIISGNGDNGILIKGTNSKSNTVNGNYIGTTGDGQSALPNTNNGITIDGATGNTIGGSDAGSLNVISGNTGDGIDIKGVITLENVYKGNYIGTNVDGDQALPNIYGFYIQVNGTSLNTIGGENPADRNLISGNTKDGIAVVGIGAGNNTSINIRGNFIGTDVNGLEDLGNGKNGVRIYNIGNVTVGGTPTPGGDPAAAGNTIAFNQLDGVLVDDSVSPGKSVGNLISRNSIFSNLGLGIELTNRTPVSADKKLILSNDNSANDADTGANGLQNYPEITKQVRAGNSLTIDGFLQSAPSQNYTIEFFSNTPTADMSDGETNNYLRSTLVATDGTGKATFHVVLTVDAGDFVTMTATDPNGNTSEISQDRDGDGLFDNWETKGIDINNDGTVDYDLKKAGANPDHKDLFVEVDYMPGHQPAAGALGDVVTAFANSPVTNPDGLNGITLHTNTDAQEAVTLTTPLNLSPAFYTLKNSFFGSSDERNDPHSVDILNAKKQAFRYCIFADTQVGTKSSGVAEIGGNDFMITVGAWSAAEIASVGGQRAAEAATFMHELGHTLGLRHGGNENVHAKPNYLSVMNYALQFTSYDPARPLDYSRNSLASLNESHLDESVGVVGPVGRGVVYGDGTGHAILSSTNTPIDWNDNGTLNEPDVHSDINFITNINTANGESTLTGFDDWANLQYTFRGDAQFANGVDSSPSDDQLTATQVLAAANSVDYDGDGIVNAQDNAPGIFNPSQSAKNGIADVITKKSTTLTDVDGDSVSVTLTGAGLFALSVVNPDANHHGSIGTITLLNTNQTSSLNITVTKKTGGNGLIHVGAIAGTGLKSITAPAADISSGINLSGFVGSLTFHDLLTGASLIAGGTGKQSTTITAHELDNTFAVQLGSAISNLTAARIDAGNISAPSLGTLMIKGDKTAAISGDFGANITLTGAGLTSAKSTLTNATISGNITAGTWNITGKSGAISAAATTTAWTANITGAVTSITTKGDLAGTLTLGSIGSFKVGNDLKNATINLTQTITSSKVTTPDLATLTVTGALRNVTLRSAGNIGTVTTGGMFDSNLFAGVLSDAARGHSGLPAARNEFLAGADNLLPGIGTVTINGLTGQANAFGNSDIAAWKLGSITLKNVLTDTPNSAVPFGIAANSIKSYTRKTGLVITYAWPNKITPAFPSDHVNDLDEVHVV